MTMNVLQRRQLEEYGTDGIDYIKASLLLNKYVRNKSLGGEQSGATVRSRLNRFALYVFKEQNKGQSFDVFLRSVGTKKGVDPFELLQEYAIYLQGKKTKPNQVRALVKSAKKFMRFCGAKIDNEDFLDRVTLPKQTVPDLEGTEKSQIVELLNACQNIRLRTALMLIGSMGCRPVEACSTSTIDRFGGYVITMASLKPASCSQN